MINNSRLARSVSHALDGIHFAFVNNPNLRIQVGVGIIVIMLSLIFDVSTFEMGILGVMILLVICAEMINCAIEEMVNFVITEHRREAKIAKDVSAGMVLVTTFGSILVGCLIFIPHVVSVLLTK